MADKTEAGGAWDNGVQALGVARAGICRAIVRAVSALHAVACTTVTGRHH